MSWIGMIKKTVGVWSDARASTFGASLSYYTLFSIAPLLVIAVAIAGFIFGERAATGQLAEEMQQTVGPQVATTLQDILKNANRPQTGGIAIVISLVILLFGASNVFNELQSALDAIWGVEPAKSGGVLNLIKERFLSFSMVLGVCFLLLVSLIISTVLSALTRFWSPETLPGGTYLWQGLNLLISLGVLTLLFAMIYKVLPDVHLTWRNVGVGALVTALLFTLGKFLLGLYLGMSSPASAFGAAGSLAVVLVWVYYSAQIVLLGAAFTRVYSEAQGHVAAPTEQAVPATALGRPVASARPS